MPLMQPVLNTALGLDSIVNHMHWVPTHLILVPPLHQIFNLYPTLYGTMHEYAGRNLLLARDPPWRLDMFRGTLHENILLQLLVP